MIFYQFILFIIQSSNIRNNNYGLRVDINFKYRFIFIELIFLVDILKSIYIYLYVL